MCITIHGNEKCLHNQHSIRKLGKSEECSANLSVCLCCWRQIRWRFGGLWAKGPVSPSHPLPQVNMSLCRPWSSALLWGGRVFRRDRSPLNSNETTVSVKQSEQTSWGPKFSLLSPLCGNWSHVICPLHYSCHMPFFKSAGAQSPTTYSLYINTLPYVCMAVYMCAILCFIYIYIYIYICMYVLHPSFWHRAPKW